MRRKEDTRTEAPETPEFSRTSGPRCSVTHSFVVGEMDIRKLLRIEPCFKGVPFQEMGLGGIQLIENIEEIAFVREMAPVLEVLEAGESHFAKASRDKEVQRVDGKIDKEGQQMREPPDNWSGEKVHKDIFHRFHEPSVESISFIGIDPHDDPSSRAAVTRNIPEGGSGIIGVMEDADRIDNIERPLQIHRRDIRFHKRHVWEFFRVTTCACDR